VLGGLDGGKTPDDFCMAVCTPSQAVPSRAGGSHYGWNPVVLFRLSQYGARPDFLAFHYYPQQPGTENDALLLADSAAWPLWASELREQISGYWAAADGSSIGLAATEINSVTGNPGKQTTGLVNALFYADSYGQMLATEFVSAQWWVLRGDANTGGNNAASLYGRQKIGNYGVVSNGVDISGVTVPSDNTPFPTYQVMRQLAPWRANGAVLVRSSTSDPMLAAYATKQSDGRLTIVVINKSPNSAIEGRFQLTRFAPGNHPVTLSTYGQSEDAKGSGPTMRTGATAGNDFSYTFAPYSCTLVSVLPWPSRTPR
jgi:hypothetical protein